MLKQYSNVLKYVHLVIVLSVSMHDGGGLFIFQTDQSLVKTVICGVSKSIFPSSESKQTSAL